MLNKDISKRTAGLFDAFKRRGRCSAHLFWEDNGQKHKDLVEAYHRAYEVEARRRGLSLWV